MFAGKKSAQIREILISESAWEEMTCLFAPSLAKKAVETIEARFRTVFERAGVGIALVAPDGGWLRVNDALCQIVGYSQDEFVKLTFQDITHPDDLDSDLYLLRQLIDDEIDRYQLEKRYITKSGNTIVWLISVHSSLK